MIEYEITVIGCDDDNTVSMELTAQEYELIDRLAALLYARSTNCCMPVMEIKGADQ